jgi:hypothetical protein
MSPDNINYIDPTSFKLVVDRLPNVEFFCKGVNIPAMTAGESTANYRQTNIPIFGDKLVYDSLTATIMVDEDMKSYLEVFNWLRESTLDTTNITDFLSDISVVITTSHNNKSKTFNFYNAFPTMIGDLAFDSGATSTEYLTVDIVFKFTDLDIS